jgi:small-conductance mechanosensitive channel
VPPPALPTEYTSPTNQLAIIALVAAILSWVLFPVFGALVGIVTGHIARGQIRRTGESGKGLALAALIIGYVHLVVVTVAAIAWLAVISSFLLALMGRGSR